MSASVPPAAPVRRDPVSPLVRKIVAASGIGFAVLLVIAIILTGGESVPEDGDPITDWTQYARDNEDNLRLGALVFAFAAYEFLLFLGFLRSVLGDAEVSARGFARGGYIVLAGGIAGIIGVTMSIGLSAGAMANPDTPPEVLKALSDMASGGWLVASAGFGACFVTVGLLNAGVRALPSWLGWVALATGIAWVLQLGVLLSDDEDNLFGVFFPLGFLLLVVFSVGASVAFLRGRDRPAQHGTLVS